MSDVFDIVIVGSGPAGLSAASRAAKRGLSHVLLEKQDHLSDTIYKYQKGKHIMATPDQLILRSDNSFEACARETALSTWDQEVIDNEVNVRFEVEVMAISGKHPDFSITLKSGETVKARNVVLGIGTAGNPNKMRVPGAELPFVQYQLDDPGEYFDENIFVIGGGDAGIENAMGLVADPEQGNNVILLQRGPDFPRAKKANVQALLQGKDQGRLDYMVSTTTKSIEDGTIVLDTRDGEERLPCDRIIARMGAAPPRKFVESCGVEFTSPDRGAFPKLSPTFETTVPGIYVIGALAGYPLIKHCMNQGYDVVERICGNEELKPADEPLLEAKFKNIPGDQSVDERLETIRQSVEIFNDLSPLQMREFMLDSDVHYLKKGEAAFQRNQSGSSLFTIAGGSVLVEVDPTDPNITVPIQTGSIFGEIGLISGRKRGATVRAAEPCLLVEVPRNAALKLMASVAGVKDKIDRISTERQLLQIFGSGIGGENMETVMASAEVKTVNAGETIIEEGETSYDIYVIRSGSMVVEKTIGGKEVFLSYLAAGAYVGEMALFEEGRRTATVRAAIKSEVVRLPGEAFAEVLNKNPEIYDRVEKLSATRRELNNYIEGQKSSFGSVVDMYSSVAKFLVESGISEATDALLIDETLCVGCDNCEKACAESHDGISRLNREAGETHAHLHVPTSCRHCEHPHCMSDCPPNAIHRAPDGEVFIDDTCIGCGNCQRNCPYGVIQMQKPPPRKPGLISWLLFGFGPGPGQPPSSWIEKHLKAKDKSGPKKAVKCDMCKGIRGGPSCVRACPTGAAIRVSPEDFLNVARMSEQ
jgi:CRP-like cAMP-binding protein/thioredoxin reductase/Fe-S-cluster-containing hydrogenase component 2